MIRVLADDDVQGHALALLRYLQTEEWAELLAELDVQFVTFEQLNLERDSGMTEPTLNERPRLLERLYDLERYRGAGRVYVP